VDDQVTAPRRTRSSAGGTSSNKFCRSEDLSNESSVEQFFVIRLLEDLGYQDRQILTKAAIESIKVGPGRAKSPYKPDYVLKVKGKPRWIVDAKSTTENPDDYIGQGSGYCLGINGRYEDNPVRYFMLTNGVLTRVYQWDKEAPIMSLRFGDFVDGNAKYEALKLLLNADAAGTGWVASSPVIGDTFLLTRPDMEDVKRTFAKCHKIIWKSEKVNPQAAFLRFAKILFVKLSEDRRLRDTPEFLDAIGREDPLPADAVHFSTRWIDAQAAFEDNPVDHILFRQLVASLETEIARKKRKRIFESGETLEVSPGTIRRVVAELQHQYLFGIDEDLNGRMFETFLVATMRGQELGQYFTPRSIVKLISRLGAPIASRGHVERVLDACCGTGGFLIEALTDMRRQLHDNTSLTVKERSALLDEVANEAIFGIDAGTDPPLVNIARINMYLHGDGGSRIYMADGLKKEPSPSGTDSVEVRQDVDELRDMLKGDRSGPLLFDLVLTNPPFSMDYSRDDPDELAVLKDYALARWGGKERKSLRSAVLFMERYHDLLKPGGRILTVIDDSVLGGTKMGFVRDFIREHFVINAVISLHGDAFHRAGARVKTSVLCLTKRDSGDTSQPDAFVYESRYVGLDDVPPSTRTSDAEAARLNAQEEIDEVVAAYESFLRGEKGPWLVSGSMLGDRLVAKHLQPWSVKALQPQWIRKRIRSSDLGELVELVEEQVQVSAATRYTFLRIGYDGTPTEGESCLGREISYPYVGRAQPGDIVVSNINAVHGATCVLPDECAGLLTTPEFTVLRMKPGEATDSMYLWSVLRSDAVRAEWLSGALGLGRTRVGWELLEHQLIPLLDDAHQGTIGDLYREAIRLAKEGRDAAQRAAGGLAPLGLDAEEARERLIRAKPPK
jgi:type I restriction enzyme M protein